MNSKKSVSTYDDYIHNHLKDQKEAALYLQAALDTYEQDNDMSCLLLAIRDVVKAQSSMTEISRKTGLNRESLYQALSEKGNPQFSSIWAILRALGFFLAIHVDKKKAA